MTNASYHNEARGGVCLRLLKFLFASLELFAYASHGRLLRVETQQTNTCSSSVCDDLHILSCYELLIANKAKRGLNLPLEQRFAQVDAGPVPKMRMEMMTVLIGK